MTIGVCVSILVLEGFRIVGIDSGIRILVMAFFDLKIELNDLSKIYNSLNPSCTQKVTFS